MPRFKLICQASVGESLGQSLRMASRCLWDEQIDSSASATWTNVRCTASRLPEPLHTTPSRHNHADARRRVVRAVASVCRCDLLGAVLRVNTGRERRVAMLNCAYVCLVRLVERERGRSM